MVIKQYSIERPTNIKQTGLKNPSIDAHFEQHQSPMAKFKPAPNFMQEYQIKEQDPAENKLLNLEQDEQQTELEIDKDIH